MLGASDAGGSACLLTDLVRAEISTCRAARFEFPCRTAPPSVERWRHEQTWARRSDLKPSAPQRFCIHVRSRGAALIQSTGLIQTWGTTDRSPPDIPAQRPTSSIHPAVRGTHIRIVHACTLEPPGRGIARGDSPMNCRSHVMSPHWNVQSQVRSGSAARTVWFSTAGIGQPANAGL